MIWEKAKQWSEVSILIQGWKQPKEDGRARETAVKSLLSCKVMKTTWFKEAISEVKTWQRDRQAWNLVPSFTLKFPLPCEIQNAMLLWSSLPFYGTFSTWTHTVLLSWHLCWCFSACQEYAKSQFPALGRDQWQLNYTIILIQRKHRIKVFENTPLGKKHSGDKKMCDFLFICIFVHIAFLNHSNNKSLLPFYL